MLKVIRANDPLMQDTIKEFKGVTNANNFVHTHATLDVAVSLDIT